MLKIEIPVTEEWNNMFHESESRPYIRRPFQRSAERDDCVTYSEPYSTMCGEPVWFYSWGNARWLRCPIGRPEDRLNSAGDRIAAIEVILVKEEWTFVVSIKEAKRHASRIRQHKRESRARQAISNAADRGRR